MHIFALAFSHVTVYYTYWNQDWLAALALSMRICGQMDPMQTKGAGRTTILDCTYPSTLRTGDCWPPGGGGGGATLPSIDSECNDLIYMCRQGGQPTYNYTNSYIEYFIPRDNNPVIPNSGYGHVAGHVSFHPTPLSRLFCLTVVPWSLVQFYLNLTSNSSAGALAVDEAGGYLFFVDANPDGPFIGRSNLRLGTDSKFASSWVGCCVFMSLILRCICSVDMHVHHVH